MPSCDRIVVTTQKLDTKELDMRASTILRKVFTQGDAIGHRNRREALLKATEALAMGASLTVTC